MKNFNRIFAFLLIATLVSATLLAGVREQSDRNALGKTSILSTGAFDGNRIDDDLENNGMIVSHRITGHSGLAWPAGNASYTIYASGVWLAGKVGGEIRTAVAEYGPEYTSGPWGSDGTNPADVLYKVNISDLDNPAGNADFANWPVAQGAPWVDVDGDGVYTPMPGGVDHPDFIGDQVIYYVMNDGVATDHSIFNTDPLGVEVRMTIWGYDRLDAFGDMMFVKAQIYNMGGNDIADAYLGLWSDPDLGNAADDFVGCDLDLSLGFCYNDGADNTFGYRAPAVGYDFFQAAFPTGDPADQQFCFGELKSGYVSLPMSSFVKYINSDDVYTDPNDAPEAYNYMSGYKRDGTPFINSATGEATKFVHPDDPNLNVDGTDNIWVDGDDNPADDRRFLMNVGPFNFNSGDSAEVVFGILHAQGNSALGSVSLLKFNDKYAQSAYDANFDLPSPPPAPIVSVNRTAGEIILEWEDNAEAYSAYVVGNNSYYNFEGYNVYQHETEFGAGTTEIVATYDLKNGVTTIKDEVFSSEFGDVILQPVQPGTDSGIKRYISITTDALNGGLPLIDERKYYFSVTAYGYNGFSVPVVLESSSPINIIRPQTDFYEDLNAETGGGNFSVTHNGTADASTIVTVANPYNLQDDTYTIFFDRQHYYRNADAVWMKTAYADSIGRLGKPSDLTGTEITGAAIAAATPGTVDLVYTLHYDSPDGAWIDGFEIDLADNLTVNGWGAIEGAYGSYPDDGQNIVNQDGVVSAGNVVTWGDSLRSGFGAIEGDVMVIINVDGPLTYPFTADYHVFDDGYGTILDAIGTVTVTELGFEFKTINHWNLRNSAGTVQLEDMTILGGTWFEHVDGNGVLYADREVGTTEVPVVDGFQVNVSGSYAAPINFTSVTLDANPLGGTTLSSSSNTGNIDIQNYTIFGGTITSYAADNFGVGTYSMNELQEDLELRFTGVLDTNVVNGQTQITVASGGSMATLFRFNEGFAAHPLGGGATSEFMIRIPFEVWNVDKGYQVNLAFRDRLQASTAEPFYAWNMVNRMYAVVVNSPYDPDTPIPGIWDAVADPLSDLATWVLVFYGTNYHLGDVVSIAYDNPLQLGIDTFEFTTTAPSAKAASLDEVKVWPNPYFGYNPEERTPLNNFIHFTNLPDVATISIFTLAGQLVRTLDHTSGQEEIWNAQNSFNVLVASGVYIAVVSTDDMDKVLKLAVVMPQQRLDVY